MQHHTEIMHCQACASVHKWELVNLAHPPQLSKRSDDGAIFLTNARMYACPRCGSVKIVQIEVPHA